MAKKLRDIRYATVADCIADVEKLRGGYRAGGNWTLAQACFHLAYPLEHISETSADPTPEQISVQGFLTKVLSDGWPDAQLPAAKVMTPPAQVGPEAIDRLLAAMKRLAEQPDGRVNAFIFGPVELSRLRRFVLVHAAHHLSFFEATSNAG